MLMCIIIHWVLETSLCWFGTCYKSATVTWDVVRKDVVHIRGPKKNGNLMFFPLNCAVNIKLFQKMKFLKMKTN